MSDNLARISTLFPQTPDIPENTNRTQQSDSNSVTTTTRARANKVASYYRECLGNPCPPRAQREIIYWIRDGIDPDMICEALDEASMAPRPSWLYARAIITRCIAEGVKTIGDYYDRQIAWHNGRR